MKGIIFNIAELFLTEKYGEETMEEIMESSDLITKDPFVGPGTYPDEDFLEIVEQSVRHTGASHSQLLKQLGHFAFHHLATRYPGFVAPYSHPKNFLKTIEEVVHVEVRKLYTDTYLPVFIYQEPAEDELIITYYSKRKLYDLMEGLISGVAEYFKINIEQQHTVYVKDGNEYCDFKLKFESAPQHG